MGSQNFSSLIRSLKSPFVYPVGAFSPFPYPSSVKHIYLISKYRASWFTCAPTEISSFHLSFDSKPKRVEEISSFLTECIAYVCLCISTHTYPPTHKKCMSYMCVYFQNPMINISLHIYCPENTILFFSHKFTGT